MIDTMEQHDMDSGWAWAVLIACFFTNMLNDGLMSSLGVFLVVWQDQFPGSVTQISWIISLVGGVMYAVGPIGRALCKIFSIRQIVMASTILSSSSFIAASFATNLWHLYVTFTLAGIGLGLTYQPSLVILAYYFDNRLARANGVAGAGVAVGVFALPPFFQVLIDSFGWNGALLIIASFVGNMGVCAAVYRPTALEIESRSDGKAQNQTHAIEHKHNMTKTHNTNDSNNCFASCMGAFDLKLLMNFTFVLLCLSQTMAGIAFVINMHYLPARAVHAGISDIKAAFLVSVIGICSLVSRLTHGYIIDYHIMTPSVFTATAYLVLTISTALNPVTDKYAGLVTLSVMTGLFSGACFAAAPVVAKEHVGVHRVSGALGLILLLNGVGIFLGSYLSGVMVDATGRYDIPFYVASACYLLCSLFIYAYPLMRHLRHQDNKTIKPHKNDLHGQENFSVELEKKKHNSMAS